MAEEAIKTELFIPPGEQRLEASILEAAWTHDGGTVVVGREAFSWLKELFQAHVADKLINKPMIAGSGSCSSSL